MLEPVYLRRADWNRVKIALDARLAASQDPASAASCCTRLATLHEEQLEDYRAALETVAKLLHEDLTDEGVWAELERLAKVASAERRLAEIYAAELGELTSDDASSAKLSRRTGELYAELGDVADALQWYRRAHEFEPDSRELFDAIDGLLVKEARHAERVAALPRGARLPQGRGAARRPPHDRAPRADASSREPEQAIETYRAALDVDENDARALDALTELYRELDRDRGTSPTSTCAAPRRPRTASGRRPTGSRSRALLRTQLERHRRRDRSARGDRRRGALARRGDPGARGAHPATRSTRRGSSRSSRPLYERADDWRQLVRLNEERFGLAPDAREKVAVLRETAKLWETRGNDELRAFDATRAAFEPRSGRRRDARRARAARRAARRLGGARGELRARRRRTTRTSSTKRELLLVARQGLRRRASTIRAARSAPTRACPRSTRPIAEPLEAMDTLAVLLSDWDDAHRRAREEERDRVGRRERLDLAAHRRDQARHARGPGRAPSRRTSARSSSIPRAR